MDLTTKFTTYPDWPQRGVNFIDLAPIIADAQTFDHCLQQMAQNCAWASSLVAVESRGFIWGTALARQLALPLILARKAGRTPGPVLSQSYQTEYSSDCLEIAADSQPGHRPVIVDDVIATGGTVAAVAQLLRQQNPDCQPRAVAVLALSFLPGLSMLGQQGLPVNVVQRLDRA